MSSRRRWNKDEVTLLLSGIYSDEELSKRIKRSVSSIQQKRYSLCGMFSRAKSYWPLEQDILVMSQTMSDSEIARMTNRTESEITRRREILRNGTTKHQKWTKEEEEIILAGIISDNELSATLLRSVDSIRRRRSRLLGRSKPQDNSCKHKTRDEMAYKHPRKSWTSEELQLTMDHSIPDSELALKLNRSISSIQGKRLYEKKKMKDKMR